ncbi:sodium:proline symporter [Salmonella enterica subsp. enterica serovar Choleraesuis]|nr:sodium:proline symporter [Salmonella enterica subsp. enterica serovar Choleraesuis]
MNNPSFLIWFSIYACAMIVLGWYVSRHHKNGDDFLLGGRSLPMILTLGSTVGTMVGTGSSVGAVGFGYTNGWAGMLYGLGGACGILLVSWLFAPLRKLRFMTMSEEMCYYTGGSKIIKNVVALLIFIASIGWLGAHILGGGLYLAWASGIDINVAKVIIALAFIVYVGIGGYSAVVWIDTVQSLVLFAGFILMAVLAVNHVGGWSHIQQAVDPAAQSLFAIDKLGMLPALSLAFVIGVGVLATPSYRQRIYSAKTVGSVRQSFTITGVLYLFFSFLPAIIGMAVWTLNPNLENSGFAFLFATQVLPPALGMAVLIAGMSANMSSGSSDAIAAVSIMLRDLYTLVTGHMPPADKAIRLSRMFLVLVIALALLFALTSNDIIGYITKMISMIMSGMFICSLLGRFWERFNWQGALAALVGGAGASLAVLLNDSWLSFWGNPCIPSVLTSLAAAVVITLLTPASRLSRAEALELITRERESQPATVPLGKPLAAKESAQ